MKSVTRGLIVPGAGGGGAGGAPTDAQYLVATANGDLTAERVTTDTATVTWDHTVAAQAKANVPDAAITYAKIQNVSATDKVLGRSTAGAGVVEEIACTSAGRALLDDADNTAQRTTLGLGTIATQAANNVAITGGSITGITDLAIADGGTGASTAAGARTNLEVAQVSVPISFGNGLGSGYAVLDNTNHYLAFCANPGTAVATAANGIGCVAQEKAGTLSAVRFGILVGGTNGSGETGSLYIRVNNTTDNTVVNNTVVWNTGITFTEYNVTGLGIALSAGDFWQVKIDPPTFATNPTAVFYFCQVTVTYP